LKLVWVLGLSLSISFLCSILEAVLLSISHSFVAVLRDRGERAGELLHRMQKRIDEPIAAILTLNTIAHTVGAAMGGAIALELWGSRWIGLFSAILTLVILLFSEIVPKTLGATYWQTLAAPAAYVLRGMIVVMKPVLVPLSVFNRWIAPEEAVPTVSRAELEVLAEIGRREGTLDEDEWQVVSNVMRLEEVTLAEVLTPRTEVIAIPAEASVPEAKDVMLDEGHLRLPVYEGDLDHIVGILLARDLWRAARAGATEIRPLIRPVQFAPEGKKVEDLIPEMRRRRAKMAVVVDEFGGTAGIVTLEDLFEEIVGEIQDEHEVDEPVEFQRRADGRVRIWGGVPVRDVSERLDVVLESRAHDTIGGWLVEQLDRMAHLGGVRGAAQPGGRGRSAEYRAFRREARGRAARRRLSGGVRPSPWAGRASAAQQGGVRNGVAGADVHTCRELEPGRSGQSRAELHEPVLVGRRGISHTGAVPDGVVRRVPTPLTVAPEDPSEDRGEVGALGSPGRREGGVVPLRQDPHFEGRDRRPGHPCHERLVLGHDPGVCLGLQPFQGTEQTLAVVRVEPARPLEPTIDVGHRLANGVQLSVGVDQGVSRFCPAIPKEDYVCFGVLHRQGPVARVVTLDRGPELRVGHDGGVQVVAGGLDDHLLPARRRMRGRFELALSSGHG
jgi:CBS domain containing-hemolysin-like protein